MSRLDRASSIDLLLNPVSCESVQLPDSEQYHCIGQQPHTECTAFKQPEPLDLNRVHHIVTAEKYTHGTMTQKLKLF